MDTIHLGNYEEFFILYMDNELSDEQVKMVDAFLTSHPDLRSELEILMSTKLPREEFSFDKKDLLAENMRLSSVDEELLLYIDGELESDRQKSVQLELAANADFQKEHLLLLQTKLDPSEVVVYPNKKELYRHTERVIPMKMWLRVAAAVVVIAIGGIVYFKNPPSITPAGGSQGAPNTTVADAPVKKNDTVQQVTASPVENPSSKLAGIETVTGSENNVRREQRQLETTGSNEIKKIAAEEQNLIAVAKPEESALLGVERPKVNSIEFNETISPSGNKLNTEPVTYLVANRPSIKGPERTEEPTDNDRKGSLKGFLRKATRVIEKRTGIDPANSNGELIIGAVAFNLK